MSGKSVVKKGKSSARKEPRISFDYRRLTEILEVEYSEFKELFNLFERYTHVWISKLFSKLTNIKAPEHKENLKKYMEFWLALFFGCLDYYYLIQHGKFLRIAVGQNTARFERVEVADPDKMGPYRNYENEVSSTFWIGSVEYLENM
jgi:hypothetical protein